MYIHAHTVHVYTCTCTSIHSSIRHFKNKTHIDLQYTHYTSSGKLMPKQHSHMYLYSMYSHSLCTY